MRVLYTCLLLLALPFIACRLAWRSLRSPAYKKRWSERFGMSITKPLANRSIWIHAVSLGEAVAATPLIKALKQRYPQYTLVITTTTPTGSGHILGLKDPDLLHQYLPYDLPFLMKRFIKSIQPAIIIVMETELWPNLLHQAKKHAIPLMIANARLTERSCLRYQKVKTLSAQMMDSIAFIAAQTQDDANRYRLLGASASNVDVLGNIKFDCALTPALIEQGKILRAKWGNRPTLIAASTHEGEETILLKAFHSVRKKFPSMLLILVPRHPERFNSVLELLKTYRLNIAQRSKNETPGEKTTVYLGDTLGDLMMLYGTADIAFVGGSLAPIGGHSLIQPAAHGLPILAGPHLHKTVYVQNQLLKIGSLDIVNNEQDLIRSVTGLLNNPDKRKKMGMQAKKLCESQSGTLEKHLDYIKDSIEL